jgi:hypothetical protein
LLDFLKFHQRALGAREKPLPRLGEADCSRRTIQKTHAEARLKLRNRSRDRRRRSSQTTRRSDETAELRNCNKDRNGVEAIHDHSEKRNNLLQGWLIVAEISMA